MKQGWQEKKLGDFAKISYGYTESASSADIGPKFLRITDLQDNTVNWSTVPYCRCSDEDFHKYKLEENDIVFARTGATTGKSFLVKNPPVAVFASYLIRVKIMSNDLVNATYLSLFFQSELYWDYIDAGLVGAAQGGFNASKLSQLNIPLPPLQEQKRIVAILDKAFSAIGKAKENAQKNLQNAKELFESYLNSVFANPGEDWEEKKLNEIGIVIGGYAFSSKLFKKSGKYQVLRIGNVRQGLIRINENPVYIDQIDEKMAKALLKPNDIIVTQTGTKNKRDYGFTALIDEPVYLLNQRIAAIRVNEAYLPKYILYYTWTKNFKNQFFANETGTVGQGNVGIGAITNAIILLCDKNKQTLIVEKINAISDKMSELEKIYNEKLSKLDELKKSILQKAFNGELKTTSEIEI